MLPPCSVGPPHLDFRNQRDELRRFCSATIFSRFFARAPHFKKFPAPHGATMSAPRSERKFWARLENLILRAHKRRWRLAWKVILELAGPEADVGTALITCCVRATCERLAAPRRWWWYACTEVHGRRQRLTEAEIRTTTAR